MKRILFFTLFALWGGFTFGQSSDGSSLDFINEWDQSKSLLKGDLVSYKSSQSADAVYYYALQDVQAGITITSSAYWSTLDDYAETLSDPEGDPATFDTPDANETQDLKAPETTTDSDPDGDSSGSSTSTFTPGYRRDGTPMDPSIPPYFDVDGYYDRNHDGGTRFKI